MLIYAQPDRSKGGFMDRRDFMKQVLLWSAGISTSIPSFRIGSELLAAEKAPPVVSHVKGKNYYELVARVLEPLGGIGTFVNTGDQVVIKPNMAWDRSTAHAMSKDGAM
jgi:hypothetical protein